MTPQQIEFVGQLVTIAGGIAAATLALLQSIKTLLEVADQIAKRRRRGRARRRVAIWLYQDRLHVEYQQTLLARYHYRLDRSSTQITAISRPRLYHSLFASPQLEMFELDDAQWVKIWRRPEYARRRLVMKAAARQLAFDFNLMLWLLLGY